MGASGSFLLHRDGHMARRRRHPLGWRSRLQPVVLDFYSEGGPAARQPGRDQEELFAEEPVDFRPPIGEGRVGVTLRRSIVTAPVFFPARRQTERQAMEHHARSPWNLPIAMTADEPLAVRQEAAVQQALDSGREIGFALSAGKHVERRDRARGIPLANRRLTFSIAARTGPGLVAELPSAAIREQASRVDNTITPSSFCPCISSESLPTPGCTKPAPTFLSGARWH